MAEAEEAVQLFSRKSAGKRKKSQQANGAADESAPKRQQQEAGAAAALPERAQGEASTSESTAASFKELGVSDWLCSVVQSLGIRRPTQVQAGCIPAILAGKDVIGTAQTGSGKTAAFALPILQHLAKDPYGIFALVLTPTRLVLLSGRKNGQQRVFLVMQLLIGTLDASLCVLNSLHASWECCSAMLARSAVSQPGTAVLV